MGHVLKESLALPWDNVHAIKIEFEQYFYVHYIVCIILCDVAFAVDFPVFRNNSGHPSLWRTPEEQRSSKWIFCSQIQAVADWLDLGNSENI